ncbi:hypothetical protein [Paraburkholderia sp. SG-MS1]|uniref:hypothetical protein n=1 Tax=Paraburkholderia sp. SG-MS1 TaxID=2023741 RepID=UPI001EEAD89D|nr:hypothetical protein [Paraburkholderia sp. SG-MS1]
MSNTNRLKPLFHLGRMLVTPEALKRLRANQIPVISVMLRHIAGDWGILSDDDGAQNDLSIAAGLRLLSVYPMPDGSRIVVVTEWNRSHTTIELIEQLVSRNAPQCPPVTVHACYPGQWRDLRRRGLSRLLGLSHPQPLAVGFDADREPGSLDCDDEQLDYQSGWRCR